MSDEHVLFRCARYRGDELRVTLGTYEGKPVVQIREWYDAGGSMRPSKKGLSLPIDQLASIASALDEALERIGRAERMQSPESKTP